VRKEVIPAESLIQEEEAGGESRGGLEGAAGMVGVAWRAELAGAQGEEQEALGQAPGGTFKAEYCPARTLEEWSDYLAKAPMLVRVGAWGDEGRARLAHRSDHACTDAITHLFRSLLVTHSHPPTHACTRQQHVETQLPLANGAGGREEEGMERGEIARVLAQMRFEDGYPHKTTLLHRDHVRACVPACVPVWGGRPCWMMMRCMSR
jgi:hypothetical protein